MSNNRIIRIFLGSSITELKNEREGITAHITNDITNLFGLGNIAIQFEVCEDIHRGNIGKADQDKIDNLLRSCDVSVFLIKENAGDKTIHEFDVARELQNDNPLHEIYVYFLKTQDEKKSKNVKAFQKRLKKEDFYWIECDGLGDVKYDLLNGLLKCLGYRGSSEKTESIAQTAEARFEQYEKNEEQHNQLQAPLRKELHKDIENLLAQIVEIWSDKDAFLITARIARTLDIFHKADHWAEATAYDKEKYSHLLFGYADFLYKNGLYYDANEIYLRQIPLAEELYGKEHKNTAVSYNNIGEVYNEQGDYDKALEYHQKALLIREKVLGTEYPETATSYNNIGVVYRKQGKYDKAWECHRKAMDIREKVLGIEHPDTAISYNSMGVVYDEIGNYEKALEYYFKAIKIVEKRLGTEHPNTASSYNNIGSVYHKQGNYNEALKYFRKALEIDEKVLGKEHPKTATDYNHLGVVCYYQGNYQKALEYFEKAYSIRMKVLGPQHHETKNTLIGIYDVKKVLGIIK